MTNNVYWILQLALNDGALDDWTALINEMVAATKENEPGALAYEYWLNDDKTVCHIYERYEDAAATMVHLGNFGKHFAQRFMSLSTPTNFFVYGAYDDAVVDALTPIGATFMQALDGFER